MNKIDENLTLAGFILQKKEINPLPDNVAKDIKQYPMRKNGDVYMESCCHTNSIIAAKEIIYENCENRIVEGVVLREDGFLFEHYWNTVISSDESSDYDVTLDIILSDKEKKVSKKYFEYKTFSILEMEQRKEFSPEIADIIEDYYKKEPTHKDLYYHSNNNMKIENFRNKYTFNTHRENIMLQFEQYVKYLESIFEYVDVIVFGSFITAKEMPNDIDIIVFGYPNQNGWDKQFNKQMKLDSAEKIHVKFELTPTPTTAKQIIKKFNDNKENKEKHIEIKKYIAINIKTKI